MLRTLLSVYDQDYKNIEVIVVDNGSTDGTVEAIGKEYPSLNLIVLEKNLGASAGRNVGIKSAQGEFIFLLDSDADIGRETLNHIVDKFQKEPDLGIIACKIVNYYTKKLSTKLEPGWPYTNKTFADQDKEFYSYRFSEGGGAIRKSVLDKIGLFWDLLYFGREGEELSLRAWEAGYKIIYYPDAIVYHRVSPHKSFSQGMREYYDLRNALLIYIVYYPTWELIRFIPIRVVVSLLRATRRGYPALWFRALIDVIKQLPSLWKLRRPISKNTARNYFQLLREHGSLQWDLVSWLKYKL
jgi:GT2 family glycosyltransferase